ncbi:MAG: DUF3299 domain-containing protein [Bacteroidia bacterium]|nr:DUF3299 domain-containing protein [Bacteroidia bacterium]
MKIFKLYLPLLLTIAICSISQWLLGQESITWKTLENVSYEMSYDSTADYVMMTPVYGESLNKLQGQEVEIKGYILPMDTEGTAFVLSAFPFSSCFFCGGGGKETVVELMLDGEKSYTVDQVKTFRGKLKLNDDPFGLNYILEEAKEVDES